MITRPTPPAAAVKFMPTARLCGSCASVASIGSACCTSRPGMNPRSTERGLRVRRAHRPDLVERDAGLGHRQLAFEERARRHHQERRVRDDARELRGDRDLMQLDLLAAQRDGERVVHLTGHVRRHQRRHRRGLRDQAGEDPPRADLHVEAVPVGGGHELPAAPAPRQRDPTVERERRAVDVRRRDRDREAERQIQRGVRLERDGQQPRPRLERDPVRARPRPTRAGGPACTSRPRRRSRWPSRRCPPPSPARRARCSASTRPAGSG